jgi:lipopolysaccharide transport system permease protein
MMAWYGLAPHSGILLLPFFVLLTMLTALSVSVWLSVINVRYRDVGQAIPFLVQIWLFASPVAYPASVVPENWRFIYNLNPLAGIIEGFRWALVGHQNPPVIALLSTTAVVLALLYGGILFFKRMEKTFADVV